LHMKSGVRGEESQSGSSKADFTNKVRISLREMRESNYWLRIIKRTVKEVNNSDLDYLIKESAQRHNGTTVQRRNGATAQRHYGVRRQTACLKHSLWTKNKIINPTMQIVN